MSNTLIEYLTNIWYVGDWHPIRYIKYNKYVKQFESHLGQSYPLGDEHFRIDHGKNYFNFFRRMGEPFYYIIFKNNTVVGTVCYVYRKIGTDYVMYLCDLKFDPKVRGTGLMSSLMYRTIPTCLMRTNKFYAVSMNSGNGINKILKMGQGMGKKYGIQIESGGILNLYSLDYDDMCFVQELVSLHKKQIPESNRSIKYISLKGIKDLIVTHKNGSSSIMKLLHMFYINVDNASLDRLNDDQVEIEPIIYDKPMKGYTHMFCTLKGSELSKDLETFSILPSSTATIIHYNMKYFNWEIIQTCDI